MKAKPKKTVTVGASHHALEIVFFSDSAAAGVRGGGALCGGGEASGMSCGVDGSSSSDVRLWPLSGAANARSSSSSSFETRTRRSSRLRNLVISVWTALGSSTSAT